MGCIMERFLLGAQNKLLEIILSDLFHDLSVIIIINNNYIHVLCFLATKQIRRKWSL